MNVRSTAAGLALALSSLVSAPALAAGPTNAEFFPFAEIMAMKMMDKNKDGMVSRKEFLDMMAMTWDMNAKKMGVKGEAMTPQQFQEILMYIRAGG